MENILKDNSAIISKIPDLYARTKLKPANESLLGTVEQNITYVASYITKTLSGISDIFTVNIQRLTSILDTDTKPVQLKEVLDLENKINSIINSDIKMIDIAKIQTPITLGFKTDLVKASEFLKIGFNLIDNSLPNMIKEVDELLSKMLSDKNYIKSTRPIKYDETWSMNYKLSELLTEIIDENGVKDRTSLENILPNINSFKVTLDNIKMVNNSYDIAKLEKIKKDAKKIAERVTILQNYLNNNPDLQVSVTIIQDFGYKLEYCASTITYAASIIILRQQVIDMLRNASKLVIKYKEHHK